VKTLKAGFNELRGMGIDMYSQNEIEALHEATLHVLANTGVKVNHKEARDIYAGAGCEIDEENMIVKIPAYVVEDAIRSAPPVVNLAGRQPQDDYLAGTGVGFTNFGEALRIIDLESKELRTTTRKDLAEITRIVDAYPEISCNERACGCNDVLGEVQTIHNAEKIFLNTSKHSFIGSHSGYNCSKMLELAYIAQGGEEKFRERPIYSTTVCQNSPLLLNQDVTEVIMTGAKGGAPCWFVSMTMSGVTAPITIAGAVVVHNCEVLAALTLQQLTVKGAKAIYGCSSLGFDLKNGTSPVGTPELAHMSVSMTKLAQFYRIPVFAAGG